MPTIPLPDIPVTFVQPAALLLLALAGAFVLIRRVSLRHLTRRRNRLVLVVRLAVLALLVMALARPLAVDVADSSAVAFLIDVSDSVGPAQRQHATEWLRQALAEKRPRDQMEVIAFAGDAQVDRTIGTAPLMPDLASTPRPNATNLAAAIRLALSTLPSDTARKIVVLSDGAENVGAALEEARLATAAGVPISFVALPSRDGPEILVRQLETPPSLRERDTFSLRVVVDASEATEATLRVLVDGRLDSSHNVQLNKGTNTFTIPHAPVPKGFHSFRVQLETAADTISENNIGTSFSTVIGKANVLLVEGSPGEGRYLNDALRAGGMEVSVIAPTAVPGEPLGLRGYDSVVLVNVPAERLAPAQQQALKTYVQSFGGGLAVVGGSQSYGAGGYAGTPLAETLPVSMDLHGSKLQSSVALILVLDTSGSMGDGPPGANKMDMAKKAAVESLSLLGPQDQFGLLAFEDSNRWVVQPTPLNDPDTPKQKIAALAPGGGTDIFPAVREAYQAMAQLQAKVRHIILLTDGVAPPGDYEGLTAQMRRDNITLSTIAVGTDADFGLLQNLAELGNGRYYEGIDPFDVPQIAIKETLEVARAAIIEQQVSPVRVAPSAIIDGLDLNGMPALGGYVATTAKPTSTTVLASTEGDPLLAEWQYGLGQVVAWTSDAENRWSADWLQWPPFAQFWTQLVKRTIPSQLDRNLQVSTSLEGGRVHTVVDALGDDGSFLNLQQSEAAVVDPQNNKQQIALKQTAPGRYEGFFPSVGEGAYGIEVTQRSADGTLIATQAAGFVVPYSPEYRDLVVNNDLLKALADQTGGLELTSPAQAFLNVERVRGGGRELWPIFIGLAILLFLVDVGARRLRVGTGDLERGWRGLMAWWEARGRPITQPATDRLLSAKRRLGGGATPQPRTGRPTVQSSAIVSRSRGRADGEQASPAEPPAAAMGLRLMAAKKRAAKEK